MIHVYKYFHDILYIRDFQTAAIYGQAKSLPREERKKRK